MKLLVSVDGKAGHLQLDRAADDCRFTYAPGGDEAAERQVSLIEVEPGIFSILADGRSYEVKVVAAAGGYYVDLHGARFRVEVRDPRLFTRKNRAGSGEGRQSVAAPMPGKVVRVLVEEGDLVEAGAGLVVVEAMKMQNEMKSPKSGRVVQLTARVGATVGAGDVLAAIE